MELSEHELEVWDKIYHYGIFCEDCQYKSVIIEPHGEATRTCLAEEQGCRDECPGLETEWSYEKDKGT
tara:strand:- start:124 stop:327 length:204 start_codon:yes stop_codon:yes gene_type:complete